VERNQDAIVDHKEGNTSNPCQCTIVLAATMLSDHRDLSQIITPLIYTFETLYLLCGQVRALV
jgi:hypothetical protein